MGDARVPEIPPDHRTGATTLSLDPLQWMRRITHQIPAKGTHLVRSFGAYANRVRKLYQDPSGEVNQVRAEMGPPLPKAGPAGSDEKQPGGVGFLTTGVYSRWTL